ncbi:alpha/beta-hydrolase [Dacryopinax primogenitus]|uniref:Alpha/beta-hydrolase n=1 Tax=Dacryopinax primogenitus (strain DJM 731) TaxID=1858805 RepID=M5G2E9_DACPD|nr:alpha/beta-hydrolase [Dacryopinax primogenitus]EJU04386.1 alpha/beta-hydrolase [Dacryopinax primogenitus]
MIDHLLGRPSDAWKRTQVFIVLSFWISVLLQGNRGGPRFLWIRRFNRLLQKLFTPWQIIVGAFTGLYAVRHFDAIVGLAAPEPLARMYSRAYYRATWIATSLDAGFATAIPIRPKWVREIAQVVLGVYYIFYANEADDRLRKFRAVCTVEMLRATWEKTGNPYLRAFTFWDRPSLPLVRHVVLPRPSTSPHRKPIRATLFYNGTPEQLRQARDLILDFPGGGFICLGPEHHEERLRRWARRTGKPILSVDYGKAPEYPYPWALEEGFDCYLTLVQTKGVTIGMAGDELSMILTADSAGANIVSTVIYRAIESSFPIPLPLAVVFNYAALDFGFGAWMSPAHLRVLREEQSSTHIPGLEEQKNHLNHRSPLSVVKDDRKHRRKKSWRDTLVFRPQGQKSVSPEGDKHIPAVVLRAIADGPDGGEGVLADTEEDTGTGNDTPEDERPIQARIKVPAKDAPGAKEEKGKKRTKKAPIGTRLTMTSRTGFFQDRIISPSMMRAMAILYIGSRHNPDFSTDYYISPILAPNNLLEKFPPLLMTCGEKDPFVDDTVIFAGRIREAKRARRVALRTASLNRDGFFGEGLRMTSKSEQAKLLEEKEEDWVQTHIYEGWSHGYMMMTALMPFGATAAIYQNADWMRMMFDKHELRQVAAAEAAVTATQPRAERTTRSEEADGGYPLGSESSSEELLEFASSKKRRLSSLSSARTAKPALARHSSSASRLTISDEGSVTGPSTPATSVGSSFGVDGALKGVRSASLSSDRPAMGKRTTELRSSPPLRAELMQMVGRVTAPNVVVNEAELMRRRREEAVFGFETHHFSDVEDETLEVF